jgi:hypothetical protein
MSGGGLLNERVVIGRPHRDAPGCGVRRNKMDSIRFCVRLIEEVEKHIGNWDTGPVEQQEERFRRQQTEQPIDIALVYLSQIAHPIEPSSLEYSPSDARE